MVEKQGYGTVVASVGELGGVVPYTSFSARKSYIENHPDIIFQFNRAIQKGLDYVHTHSDLEVAYAIQNQFPDSSLTELVRGIEREHEVEDHFVNLLRATVGLVDLVHHDDGLEANLQGLLQHKARLGHRTLEGVDKQQTAVGHVQYALHLATEVGVSRSVEDVDFRSFPIDTDILRKNGDASFALKVVSVQHLRGQVLSLTEQISGQHHLVHECCLPVVYVCNNCNVSDILHN